LNPPAHWEADVVLADGGTVHVRPVEPTDAARLVALHESLSPETIHYRFFSPRPRLSAREVERFTNVDHDRRVALTALLHGEMFLKGADLWFAQLARVPLAVEQDEFGDPVDVGLFGGGVAVRRSQGAADLIQEFGFLRRGRRWWREEM
jgi:hypothetical protein